MRTRGAGRASSLRARRGEAPASSNVCLRFQPGARGATTPYPPPQFPDATQGKGGCQVIQPRSGPDISQLRSGWLGRQFPVEDGRAARAALRPEGVVGDRAATLPAEAGRQTLGVTADHGVEHEPERGLSSPQPCPPARRRRNLRTRFSISRCCGLESPRSAAWRRRRGGTGGRAWSGGVARCRRRRKIRPPPPARCVRRVRYGLRRPSGAATALSTGRRCASRQVREARKGQNSFSPFASFADLA